MNELTPTPPPSPKSFEEALARLEEIATRLDRNEAPLAEALALCAEAAELTRYCRAQLAAAEGRLEQLLVADDGSLYLSPMQEEE